jgi:hypothetical protein
MSEVEHFQIHSLVRHHTTRHHRMLSAERHRFSMLLGGGLLRVIRRRPTVVTRGMIEQLRAELLEKEQRGMLMVTTMPGLRVDINTLLPITDVPVSPPLPEPLLDSAENDETFEAGVGTPMPQMLGGLPQTADVELPAVVAELVEAAKDEEPEEASAPAVVQAHAKPELATYNDQQQRRGRRR